MICWEDTSLKAGSRGPLPSSAACFMGSNLSQAPLFSCSFLPVGIAGTVQILCVRRARTLTVLLFCKAECRFPTMVMAAAFVLKSLLGSFVKH